MVSRTLLRVLLVVSLTGCSEKAAPADADATDEADETDAKDGTDDDEVGARVDAGTRVDGGTRKDAGSKGDPAPVDAGADSPSDPLDAAPPSPPAASDGGIAKSDASTSTDAGAAPSPGGALALTSPVYQEGMAIPATSRCESPSPPVSWTAGPSGTKSYALTLIDVTPGISMGYVHWQIYDIPATRMELPMGVPAGAPMDLAPVKQGPNYSRTRIYTGPCGGNNMYELTLYAIDVDTLPMLTATATSAQVMTAIEAHDLAKSTIHVTSSR
jgi:Raf kinase inhibitor-like YbhB/YbcL family protein